MTLITLAIPPYGLKTIRSEDSVQMYSNVNASFCYLDWSLQQQNPAQIPMFEDLLVATNEQIGQALQDSPSSSFSGPSTPPERTLCQPDVAYTVDFWEIVQFAKAYDASSSSAPITSIPPTGAVFHETRCGSTLISNLLTSFAPMTTRVYVESSPPQQVIDACSGLPIQGNTPSEMERRKQNPYLNPVCDEGAQDALLQDVFYMMGRTPNNAKSKSQTTTTTTTTTHIFYKFQNIFDMDVFTRAMPDIPWIYSYRDSVEVLMSHFKKYRSKDDAVIIDPWLVGRPMCLRDFNDPYQHPILWELAAIQNATPNNVTEEEYCALFLAGLGTQPMRVHENNTQRLAPHWFVNYRELPSRIWRDILPAMIGRSLTNEEVQRMKDIAHSYSKTGQKQVQEPMTETEWKDDSDRKRQTAPEVIRKAAAKFLDQQYVKMEEIRKSMDPTDGRGKV